MSETVTEQIDDDFQVDVPTPQFHPILEVWSKVLISAETESKLRITPQWANRIVSSYREIRFSDTERFHKLYFEKVLALLAILQEEIAQDPECLNVASAEEDLETNTLRYLNVLITWQQQFLVWELDWRSFDKDAAIEIAALSEVHKMFFGETGLLGLLDQIKFEFTEERQQMLLAVLEQTSKEMGGE